MPQDLSYYVSQYASTILLAAAQASQQIDALREELIKVQTELAALKAKEPPPG